MNRPVGRDRERSSPTIAPMRTAHLTRSVARPLAAVAVIAVLSTLAACGSEDDGDVAADPTPSSATSSPSEPTDSSSSGTFSPPADGDCAYVAGGEAAKDVELPSADPTEDGEVPVTIETNIGDLAVTLDAGRAPCTVNSFLSLAEQGYFDDTTCHRLTTDGFYVLQCGDPTGTGMGGPGYTIPDELQGDEDYSAGTLAMAKTAYPNSGGSQFFIVYGDSGVLPPDYTEFGSLDDASIKLIEKAAADGTDDANGPGDGHPNTAVDISGVKVG
ncbi:unannotated protein [freshwater metagenome]|uniref:Unannotated protein n=1 Tax=freshwater metagenome TaxID=449393 RepID=A0A6J6RLT3_9ZZZZ